MLHVAVILLVLATLVAAANVAGCAQAILRQRRGSTRGYSCVPLLSTLLAGAAWLLGGDRMGLWPLVPALLDPGTWMIPMAIGAHFLRRRGGNG
jgi:hypothetical protein